MQIDIAKIEIGVAVGISGFIAEGYCQIAPFLQSEIISISNPYIVTCLAREGAASKSLRLL